MSWTLTYEGFDPREERLREALCTLGNGYFATRGAGEESKADEIHYPGTYLGGGYNRLETRIAGRIIENEDLVNLPNWLCLTFAIDDGPPFHPSQVDLVSYRQTLHLREGLFEREIRFRDSAGRETHFRARRLVHMGFPHLAALELTITPANWSGRLRVHSAIDGRVVNAGVPRYRALNSRHLIPLATSRVDEEGICLLAEFNQSALRIAEAARTQAFEGEERLAAERQTIEDTGYIAHELTFEAEQDRPVRIEKVCALYSSRDRAISEPALGASQAIRRAPGFADLLESQTVAWKHLWDRCDIQTEGEGEPQFLLRLHIFHLLQTVSMNTIGRDVGVPARGLHGEAYRGHVFWDELFIFPFLNFRLPELTRSLLQYRYRRLPEARAAARKACHEGAMFPWQSGSSGREESQVVHLNPRSGRWVPDETCLQRHVNSAIVYNVWQYYQVTGDREFLAMYGAELMLEIARFWSSLATYNATLERYEILGVVGPDEYHERYPGAERGGLNNNTYTNIMAVWALCRALDVLETIELERRQELTEALRLRDEEVARWTEISRRMRVVFHQEDPDIVSQFEGYEQLEEFDWAGYRARYGDIHRLDRILEAEGDSASRYKVSKQADVLMLFYLFSAEDLQELFTRLGYRFDPATIPKNIAYYLRRTSHGSTLSRVVHSWVLARSDREHSWRLFADALRSDISDVQRGTTEEGIHLGAMAGTVDLVQRGHTGLEVGGEILRINPCVPAEMKSLSLRIRYRGHWFDLFITEKILRVTCRRSLAGPARIAVKDRTYQFEQEETQEFSL
jgi:alpha,alpha-trehalase